MRRYRVLCQGVSPLMMDCMSDAVLEGLRTGVHPQTRKDRPAVEEAASKLYREGNEPGGKIGFPITMLFACLVAAGRAVKFAGRKMVSTLETTLLPDFFALDGEFLPLEEAKDGEPEGLWVVDKRRGQGQTGSAVCVTRPKFSKWSFWTTFDFDDKKVGLDTIQALFTNAGSAQGLGSFRPNKRGQFGRFAAIKWEDITPAEWLMEEKSGKKNGSTPAEETPDNNGDDGLPTPEEDETAA